MADDANTVAPTPGVLLSGAQARTVRAVVERVVPGAEVWVFGSRATGRARPFSDLDLLLVCPVALSRPQRAALRDGFEASDLPFLVDVVEAADLRGGWADRVNAERRRLG